MRLKMFIVAVSVLFFMVGSSFAADVTGKWEGEMAMPKMGAGGGPGGGGPGGGGPGGGGMGQMGPMKWNFDLTQDGTTLTGSVKGPRGNANDIVDGKIEGDKLSFKVKVQGMQGNEMTIKYEGTISGEEISFQMSFEGGMGGRGGGGPGGGGFQMPAIVAKRVK